MAWDPPGLASNSRTPQRKIFVALAFQMLSLNKSLMFSNAGPVNYFVFGVSKASGDRYMSSVWPQFTWEMASKRVYMCVFYVQLGWDGTLWSSRHAELRSACVCVLCAVGMRWHTMIFPPCWITFCVCVCFMCSWDEMAHAVLHWSLAGNFDCICTVLTRSCPCKQGLFWNVLMMSVFVQLAAVLWKTSEVSIRNFVFTAWCYASAEYAVALRVTFNVIHLLQVISNVIFLTAVQQLTRFQLTALRAIPLRLLSFLYYIGANSPQSKTTRIFRPVR